MRSLIRFSGLVLILSASGCGDDGGSGGGSDTGTSSTSSTPADTNPPGPDDDGGQTPDPTPGGSLDSSGTGDGPATSSGDATAGGTTAGDTTTGGAESTGGAQASYGPCPGGEDDECADGEVCRTGNTMRMNWTICTIGCKSVKECADPENDFCVDIPGDGEFSEWCGPVEGCSFGNPCPGDMTCVAGFEGAPNVCVWSQ